MSEPTNAPRDREPDTGETLSELYRFVSGVLADPPSAAAIEEFQAGAIPEPDGLPPGALREGFGSLREWADGVEAPAEAAAELEREHTRLFVGPRPSLQVHESYYADDYLGEPLAAVKGTYAGLGIQPSEDLKEEADHAAVELAALSVLSRREGESPDDKRLFLRDHGWWLPELAADLRDSADSQFYRAIADVLDGLVRFDAERFEVGLESSSNP
ncbi:putative component of anaerobic dehydrogenase [Halalkaliarchaeum sp. AArc-CO]|uniref:TorD/DmsD family molecular chaperone n=1 Tax=unclassified Halalkaliarchaeum TaxID=2678344 RepID=UPI00217D4C31|nr:MULTISPECIES: molecular chaperone TorD family protein [unclassified Halalkaliarchaeum]MDR5671744.1 molecular chaperone TorD family protein [Halalkaliarchaeum sp. AArc-GB]UWG51240.1 putative component of anaerobic dehydrogenase [Halalkaliarchaeum sp. AArc-CO]